MARDRVEAEALGGSPRPLALRVDFALARDAFTAVRRVRRRDRQRGRLLHVGIDTRHDNDGLFARLPAFKRSDRKTERGVAEKRRRTLERKAVAAGRRCSVVALRRRIQRMAGGKILKRGRLVLLQVRRMERGFKLGIERRGRIRSGRGFRGLCAEDRRIGLRLFRRGLRHRLRRSGFRRAQRQAVALGGAHDLGEIRFLIRTQHWTQRIAADGTRDVDALTFEAGEAIGCRLKRARAHRARQIERGDLKRAARGGEQEFLPALGDARLARQQRGEILIADFGRAHCHQTENKAEGREPRALRPVTQHKHRTLTQLYACTHATEPHIRCNSIDFVVIELKLPRS